MLYHILLFAGGAVSATVIWFFILRNNKKKFAEWMSAAELYFADALSKIDNLGDEASGKIDEILANFKNIKK